MGESSEAAAAAVARAGSRGSRRDRPLRVAWVSETFLPKVDGVVTRLTATLTALAEQGHEVLVLAPPGAPYEHAGHRVVSAPGVRFPWYPAHKVALPAPRLEAALRGFAPDLVHVINPILFGSWGAVLARRARLPLVASFHTDPKVVKDLGLGVMHRPLEVLDREVHNLAHVNLCTSPQMVELARGLGIRRVRLWHKAVDTERFNARYWSTEMRARLTDGEPDAPLVVYAGRVSFEKRVEVLADAADRLAAAGARLAVVGEGPALAWLRGRLAGTKTVFTGFLAGEELSAAYASGDVFAFPSTSETLGFAALEAMASGVPVVAADAGGLPHVVHDGETGVLVPPGDAVALATAIERLIADRRERERLALAGRAEAERWSWGAATEDLVARYRQAVRVAGLAKARAAGPGSRASAAVGRA